MITKSTRRLILAASLFLVPVSVQSVFAADLGSMATSSLEKVNAAKTEASALSSINLNTATADQLALIKGIGTATAESIIEYRDTHGDFSNITDLTNVKGIGTATLEKIKPYLSL